MIKLKGLEPFAAGGNRLCFVHPAFSERCIKVRRPDFTLEDLRRRKGFPHSLFPASRLDESVKENRILKACEKKQGEKLFEVVARNYGFVDTDMGLGLCSELIRNEDGRISFSVMEYVWENGKSDSLMLAVERFEEVWPSLMIPSRDLLLHNVVAQCDVNNQIKRLVLIDGLGYSGLIPFFIQPGAYKVRRAKRKLKKFRGLIDELVETKRTGDLENKFWKQKHDGLPVDEGESS